MDWKALEAMTDGIVLGRNAETVWHHPKTKEATSDPSRPIQPISGVLHAPDPAELVSFGKGFHATLVSSKWALAFIRADYPDIKFGRYDLFRATEREGQPWFEFKEVLSYSPSMIVVILAPA